MAQQKQISISEPALENSPSESPPVFTAKRSLEQTDQIPDAVSDGPMLKKVKVNDAEKTSTAEGNRVVEMKEAKEETCHPALAVLDDGVKDSDAASGRSAWCMELGEY